MLFKKLLVVVLRIFRALKLKLCVAFFLAAPSVYSIFVKSQVIYTTHFLCENFFKHYTNHN